MQVFRTRFTADVNQVRTAMDEMRNNIRSSMASSQRIVALTGIGFAGGGISVGMLGKSMISLAANMEKTKVAFEVMLGSADKAQIVLGQLVRFADITPFDTAEIIQAGRALMACGVATDALNSRLTLLGNIAAGSNMQIGDMVAIYAKMANKGKVQTEELNQMAERGIPIYKLLCDMLKVNQEELSSMAEKGQLSFALIQEALEKLGGEGGQYFGLIEKQSKTLDGLWSTLQGNIRLLATSLGELVIPELSKNLENVIAKLDEMKKSGELDQIMRKTADAITNVLRTLKEIAMFLSEHKDQLLETAGVIACWYAWGKLNGALMITTRVLCGMQGLTFAQGVTSLRRMSPMFKVLTADVGALRRTLGSVGAGLHTIGAAAAVAFTGWQIGKRIGEMLQLEKAFTRLLLKAQGKSDKEIDELMNGDNKGIEANVKTVDYVDSEKKLKRNAEEIAKLKKDLALNEKSSAPGKEKITSTIKGRIKELEGESEGIKNALVKYEKDVAAAKKRKAEIREKLGEGRQEETKLENRKKELEKSVEPEYIGVVQNTFGEPGPYIPKDPVMEAKRQELAAVKSRLSQVKESQRALKSELDPIDKTIFDHNENLKRREQQATRDTLAEGAKRSAVEEAIAKRRLENQKTLKEHEARLAKERKKDQKERQALIDEQNHDFVAQKIQGWRDEIEQYEKDIEKAEKMLRKFGQTLEDDILKTPEQIAQERKDDILRKKIEAYNKGEKVTFTKEEQEQVKKLQDTQKKARELTANKETNQGYIKDAENAMDAYDRKRKQEEWRERANSLKNRSQVMAAANEQIRIAKEGNAPMEAVLKKIEEILKKGLPNETL